MPILWQWRPGKTESGSSSSGSSSSSSSSADVDAPASERQARGAPLPRWDDDDQSDDKPSVQVGVLPRFEMQHSSSSDSEGTSESGTESELSGCSSEPLSEETMGQARALCADFTRERVLAVLSGADKTTGTSTLVKRATSKSRVKQLLRASGGCRCSRQCGRQFSMQRLLPVVELFWQLPKQSQDALLWSLAGQRMPLHIDEKDCEQRNKRHLWVLDGPLPFA